MAGYFRPGDDFAGRYRIDREIGRGGMGIVYEAYDRELGRSVALKLLHPSLTDDEFQVRFQREASILARIKSRHIVTIHDFGEHDGQSYLITELMADGDLQTWLRTRGPLPRHEALSLVAQVCEALADAHAVKVIHRDVKPGNVLLWARPSGLVPFLCDFGIAIEGDTSLTRTGTLVGSPAYMAPERHFGEPADERGDIYSVGCLLWSVLTGDAPYSGTDFQVSNAHINEPIPQLGTGAAHDVMIDVLLLRCLSKQPDERIGSAAELQAALQRIIDSMPAAAAAAPVAGAAASAPGEARDGAPEPVADTAGSGAHAVPAADSATGLADPRVPTHDTVHKRLGRPAPVDPTVFKHLPPVPPPPPPAGPVPETSGADPKRRRPWPVVAASAAVLGIVGAMVAVLVLNNSSDDPVAADPSDTPSATSPAPAPPPAPGIKPRSGYRSVSFTFVRPAGAEPGLVVQWRDDDRWVDAKRSVRLPATEGGERVCIAARSAVVVDGETVAGDPVKKCQTSAPRVVELVRTAAACSKVVNGYRYPCVYYAVRVEGFASGAKPIAEIKPLTGRSWCEDPRYQDRFCRRVPVDESGRGALDRYFAITSETGRVVLDVDGVRTRPVHLYGPRG